MWQKNTAPRDGISNYDREYTTACDARRQFADAIFRDTGAVISPIADGEVHRFDDVDGKGHNLACWYVLYLDGRPA